MAQAEDYGGWSFLTATAFANMQNCTPNCFVQPIGRYIEAEDSFCLIADSESPSSAAFCQRALRRRSTYSVRFGSRWLHRELLLPTIDVYFGDADLEDDLPLLVLPIVLTESSLPFIRRASKPGGVQVAVMTKLGTGDFTFTVQTHGEATRMASHLPLLTAFDPNLDPARLV